MPSGRSVAIVISASRPNVSRSALVQVVIGVLLVIVGRAQGRSIDLMCGAPPSRGSPRRPRRGAVRGRRPCRVGATSTLAGDGVGGSLAGLELFDSLSGVPTPGPIGEDRRDRGERQRGGASFQVDRVTVGYRMGGHVATVRIIRGPGTLGPVGGLRVPRTRPPHATCTYCVRGLRVDLVGAAGSGTGAWGSGTRGRPLMQRSVRTMSVVMLGELLQHLREVAVWVPRTRSRHAACTYS